MTTRWSGKIIGGLIGLFAGGPFGAAIGAVLGHQYDQNTRPAGAVGRNFGAHFFSATFEVMGHIAKADGRVSEREIAAARAVMAALRLDEPSVHAAIACFRRGKQPDFDYAGTIHSLRAVCAGRPDLLRIFFEIQMRAALDGTDLAPPTRDHVRRLAQSLGISAPEFAHIEAALRSGGRPGARPAAPGLSLEEAYSVLEVGAGATDAEVTKAYRRQLSRHHPDKLKANGLPDSMIEHAKERTQQIILAWERVRAARGIRS
ncbi:MAG: Co-chaperone protein DjlA [Steroidobacteraceae bacterium]|nr:Co-chaperone protein DjlA [Steroidobacteraceae bacterium]